MAGGGAAGALGSLGSRCGTRVARKIEAITCDLCAGRSWTPEHQQSRKVRQNTKGMLSRPRLTTQSQTRTTSMLHGIHTSSAQGRSQKGPGLSAGVPLLLKLAAPPPRTTLTQGRTGALAGSLVHKHPDARASPVAAPTTWPSSALVWSLMRQRGLCSRVLSRMFLGRPKRRQCAHSSGASPALLEATFLASSICLRSAFSAARAASSASSTSFDSGSTGGDALGVNGLPSFLCPYPR